MGFLQLRQGRFLNLACGPLKYNEELMQTFHVRESDTSLEASLKYRFGSVGVLGQTNDSVISGAFITRGLEIKPVVARLGKLFV